MTQQGRFWWTEYEVRFLADHAGDRVSAPVESSPSATLGGKQDGAQDRPELRSGIHVSASRNQEEKEDCGQSRAASDEANLG